MHERGTHDLEALEDASGRNARDAADLDATTAAALLEARAAEGDDSTGRAIDPERTP